MLRAAAAPSALAWGEDAKSVEAAEAAAAARAAHAARLRAIQGERQELERRLEAELERFRDAKSKLNESHERVGLAERAAQVAAARLARNYPERAEPAPAEDPRHEGRTTPGAPYGLPVSNALVLVPAKPKPRRVEASVAKAAKARVSSAPRQKPVGVAPARPASAAKAAKVKEPLVPAPASARGAADFRDLRDRSHKAAVEWAENRRLAVVQANHARFLRRIGVDPMCPLGPLAPTRPVKSRPAPVPGWRKQHQHQHQQQRQQQQEQHVGNNNHGNHHSHRLSGTSGTSGSSSISEGVRKSQQLEPSKAREPRKDERGGVLVVVAGRASGQAAGSGTPGSDTNSGDPKARPSQGNRASEASVTQQEEGPLTTKTRTPAAASRTNSGGRGAGAGAGAEEGAKAGAGSTSAATAVGAAPPSGGATGPAARPAATQADKPAFARNGPPDRLTRGGTFEETREPGEADAGVFTDSEDSGDEVYVVVASNMHRKSAGARAASATGAAGDSSSCVGDWRCEMCKFPSNRRDMGACVLCGAPPPCAKLDLGQIALASDDDSGDEGGTRPIRPEDDDAVYRDDFDEE